VSEPPKFYQDAKREHPQVFAAFEQLQDAARRAGPLGEREAALVKLGLAIGAGLESSVHSATRKALAAGCSADEIRHAALLAVTTLGFPSMMRARAWVEDVLDRG
jgi:alkylhydroperoxidase/carboxymuconolactone decarboxylase family protein YurZ